MEQHLHLYDNQPDVKKLPQISQISHFQKFQDLNSPEISLDLQNLIDESQFNDSIFNDFLQPQKFPAQNRYQRLNYTPQASHFSELKEENFQKNFRKNSKNLDKNTDEYKKRRERNNIAVRKSREKAKLRSKETEERAKILLRENEKLQKKIDVLTEELNVLRSLFSNVGILPEHVQREINRYFETYPQH